MPDRPWPAPAPAPLRGCRENRRRPWRHWPGVAPRVRKPDILYRHAHQPPRDIEWVLAPCQHARQPIQRGIGIGAAHRFMQGTDEIVMAVLALSLIHISEP